MALLLRRLALPVLLCASQSSASSGRNYIVQEDRDTQEDALFVMNEFCLSNGEIYGELTGSREELLDDLGGEDPVQTFADINQAEKDGQTNEVLQEKYTVGFILGKAWMMVMAILASILWVFCCWSSCCCRGCRRCRCGEKEKVWPIHVKGGCLCINLVIIVFILLMGLSTQTNYTRINDGFDNLMCSTASLVNTTFSGSQEPGTKFIGLIPLLEEFDQLDQQLDDNSSLMSSLDSIIDATKAIDEAMVLMPGVLGLLGDALNNSQNVRPKSSGGDDLMHYCTFCTAMAQPVLEASDVLRDSLPTALRDARAQIREQVNAETRQGLQESMRSSATDLVSLKQTVRDALDPVINGDNGFYQYKTDIADTMWYVLFVLILFALLWAGCGCCGTASWLAAHAPNDGEKWTRVPHRIACCTWCNAWGLLIIAFFVSGIITVILIPLAGMCVVLDDLDRDTLLTTGLAEESEVMVLDMVDACFAGVPINGQRVTNLLDIWYTEDSNGTKTYMREYLVSSVMDPIDAAFDNLDAAASSFVLANNTAFTSILGNLTANPIDANMIADGALMGNDSTLSPMALYEPLQVGFATSSKCNSHTVSLGGSSQDIPGVTNFVDKLKDLGTGTGVTTAGCIEKVTCTVLIPTDANYHEYLACQAGNNYLDLKLKIMDPIVGANLFHCDLFEDSLGSLCDPKDMTKSAAGVWENDCLKTVNGVKQLVVKPRTCNLAEFTQYVEDFKPRLEKVLARLDDTTADVFDQVATGMRNLVNTHMIGPLHRVADGMDCEFIGRFLQGTVDALCYQSMHGIKGMSNVYVGCAIALVILTIKMYAVWRMNIDNVNVRMDALKPQMAKGGAVIGKPADAEGDAGNEAAVES